MNIMKTRSTPYPLTSSQRMMRTTYLWKGLTLSLEDKMSHIKYLQCDSCKKKILDNEDHLTLEVYNKHAHPRSVIAPECPHTRFYYTFHFHGYDCLEEFMNGFIKRLKEDKNG